MLWAYMTNLVKLFDIYRGLVLTKLCCFLHDNSTVLTLSKNLQASTIGLIVLSVSVSGELK